MRDSLAVGNSFYFAINANSVDFVIYLRARDPWKKASLARRNRVSICPTDKITRE